MFGEAPVLGALFASKDYQMEKTELLIIVTSRLVQPLQPDHSVPTDAFIRPERGEFMLQNRLEKESDPSDFADVPIDAPIQMIEKTKSPSGTVEPSGFQMR